MALNISAWSIRKPIPSLVLFVVLIALGAVSLKTLPITQLPNIDIPIVTITVVQTGAAPSELETPGHEERRERGGRGRRGQAASARASLMGCPSRRSSFSWRRRPIER